MLEELTIPTPSIEYQKRIVFILGALDGKIDGNYRLAGALEKVVATQFEGRFISSIQLDGDIGALPSKWAETTLEELAAATREPAGTKSQLPYIGLNEMPQGSTILGKWLTDEAPSGQGNRFKRGDILLGKLRPYFRKVGVAPIDGRCSTEILVLRPHDDRYWGFVFGHVASQRFIDHCVAVSRGTRMPRAEWKDAGSFVVRVPPPEVAAEHTQLARELYAKIRALVMEARTLAGVRDALLPKLISGEIRIPDTADPAEAIGAAEVLGA